jgi:hypothetical protein
MLAGTGNIGLTSEANAGEKTESISEKTNTHFKHAYEFFALTFKPLISSFLLPGCAMVHLVRIHDIAGKLTEWETFYNFHRLRGGLHGKKPLSKFCGKS